ncbi:ABC transporter substrate-binding protein [Rhodococcus globerulus]|uniref:ABC transporter substrate-binding protein n=1 Tax=Rhodococcus globerulus TaxID=33008 RepID=UPI000A78524F|nr:extracellular solute-binding protein [Rhodococcus globerulus]
MSIWKWTALVAVGTIATLSLSACGSATGGGTTSADGVRCTEGLDLAALTEAAQKEGQVNWYQVADPRTAEALGAAFKDKYGISTAFTRAAGADLEQRFRAEQESGSPSADVIVPLYGQFFEDTIDEGWVAPLKDSAIPEFSTTQLPAEAVLENTVAVQTSAFGWGINTDDVGTGDRPANWDELLDPKWRGKILYPNIEASPDYMSYWYLVSERYGIPFLEKLNSQFGRTYAGAAPSTQGLAAGEGSILAPGVAAAVEGTRDEGAPVEFVASNPGLAVDSVVGVVKNAEHPCAARLFVHFLMSEEGMSAFSSTPGVMTPVEATAMDLVHQSPELEAAARQSAPQIKAALAGR